MSGQRCLSCTMCGATRQFDATLVMRDEVMKRDGSRGFVARVVAASLDIHRAHLHRNCPRRQPGQLRMDCNVVECDPLDDPPREVA